MAHTTTHGFEYEFFGPYAPILIMLALPGVVLGLVYACNASGCFSLWHGLASLPGFPPGQQLYTHEAMAAVLGWFGLVLLLHLLLPGERARGVPLADGRRLEYKLNGARVLLLLLLLLLLCCCALFRSFGGRCLLAPLMCCRARARFDRAV